MDFLTLLSMVVAVLGIAVSAFLAWIIRQERKIFWSFRQEILDSFFEEQRKRELYHKLLVAQTDYVQGLADHISIVRKTLKIIEVTMPSTGVAFAQGRLRDLQDAETARMATLSDQSCAAGDLAWEAYEAKGSAEGPSE